MAEEKVSVSSEDISKVSEAISKYPNGATQENILAVLPNMTRECLAVCLNKLMTQDKINVLQKKDRTLLFKLKSSSSQKYQGSDIEEKVIFEAIEKAGNNGIASKELKMQLRMTMPQINKNLKSLESRKLIKCITSSTRKKLYLLYNLEPSHTVTGGTFYSGEDFESEFVDVIADQCYKYLVQAKAVAEKQLLDPIARRNASCKSGRDICDYINGLKISKVNLSLKDIEKILDSLVYDDKIEKSTSLSKNSSKSSVIEIMYRCSKTLIDSAGLMMVPCGVCKVYMDCHINGEISPATCAYMKDWLDF